MNPPLLSPAHSLHPHKPLAALPTPCGALSQETFLANNTNKKNFIALLMSEMEANKIQVAGNKRCRCLDSTNSNFTRLPKEWDWK